MSYDTKCKELAVAFLEDHYDPVPETKIAELAQVIQDAIEDHLNGEGVFDREPMAAMSTAEFLNDEFQKIFGPRK